METMAAKSHVTKHAVDSFWEHAAVVVNSLVFLLVGLEIQLSPRLTLHCPGLKFAVEHTERPTLRELSGFVVHTFTVSLH